MACTAKERGSRFFLSIKIGDPAAIKS